MLERQIAMKYEVGPEFRREEKYIVTGLSGQANFPVTITWRPTFVW